MDKSKVLKMIAVCILCMGIVGGIVLVVQLIAR
jgi:hypothetical protein